MLLSSNWKRFRNQWLLTMELEFQKLIHKNLARQARKEGLTCGWKPSDDLNDSSSNGSIRLLIYDSDKTFNIVETTWLPLRPSMIQTMDSTGLNNSNSIEFIQCDIIFLDRIQLISWIQIRKVIEDHLQALNFSVVLNELLIRFARLSRLFTKEFFCWKEST